MLGLSCLGLAGLAEATPQNAVTASTALPGGNPKPSGVTLECQGTQMDSQGLAQVEVASSAAPTPTLHEQMTPSELGRSLSFVATPAEPQKEDATRTHGVHTRSLVPFHVIRLASCS